MTRIPAVNSGKVNEQPPTEFHRLYQEWNNTIFYLVKEYPITAGVTVLAGSFFGFFALLHLSLSSLIAGGFMLTVSVSTAREIQKNWDVYWSLLMPSVGRVKDFLLSGKATA
jgi:hypothetical protein